MEGKNESKHTLSQEDREVIASQAEKAVNVAYDIDYPYEKMWVKGYQSGAEWGILHERERLRAEVDRLKNDLLDALDLKQGKGPTALSMLKNEVDRLTKEKSEAIQKIKYLEHAFCVSNSKYTDWIPTGELNDAFSDVRDLLTRIK